MRVDISRSVPFERPLLELEAEIAELEEFTSSRGIDRTAEIAQLRARHRELLEKIYASLTPWDRVLLARHPARPYTLDYVPLVFDEFLELRGDRCSGDDRATVAGLARLDGRPVALIGHQKGRNLKERQMRNFGSAGPQGYRKAVRVMKLAERFGRPVVCIIDTPAAESREEAEARGIAGAIAESMATMSALQAPIVVVVIGEGGSGGAIAIGVGDRIIMLENSIYSVIPPEGCAAILSTFGMDASKAPQAAQVLKLGAQEALELGVVDEVLPEPLGGAHRDLPEMAARIKRALVTKLEELSSMPQQELLESRYQKFRRMGKFLESSG
jgi:acetyl-CoA carboxylase carboxyl transferase subunit alpha